MDNSFSRIAIRSLELDNLFSRVAIRSLELDNPFSRVAIRSLELHISNSRERIAIWENELSNSREQIAIRENGLSNSRERIAIRENELSNSRERITNPRERIVQFDITSFLWLFWKSLCPFRAFVIFLYLNQHRCLQITQIYLVVKNAVHEVNWGDGPPPLLNTPSMDIIYTCCT